MDSNDLLSFANRLSELLVKLNEADNEDNWQQVTITARVLADGLRVRDGTGTCGDLVFRISTYGSPSG